VRDLETSSCNAEIALLNSINSGEVVASPVVSEERKTEKRESDDVLRPDELVSDWELELSSESDSMISTRA